MILSRQGLPPAESGFVRFAFPDSREGPAAIMSLAPRGDMKFLPGASNLNRETLLLDSGLASRRFLGIELAHSRNVITAHELEAGERDAGECAADGILSCDHGHALGITVADCMPIWIWDEVKGCFGVLHSGWKGTGILGVAIRRLIENFDSRPGDLRVILGPAIGPCCYAVPAERAETFAREFGDDTVSRRGGTYFIDLRLANLGIARESGVGRLLSVDACTACEPRLGSYRRQGATAFTRMAAVCGYTEESAAWS